MKIPEGVKTRLRLNMSRETKIEIFSFLFPMLAMMIIFALLGVYPAGSKTVLTVDLYHQYMPFIYELRAKILEGRSLFYTWNDGLGTEYYAAFANYCASPLNLLCLLFPYKTLPVFVAFITAVRAGLASLFMLKFLSETEKRGKDFVTLSFAVSYALSGWFLTDFWNIMWCDAFVLLPLICMGLLRLIRKGQYGLYVIPLAVCLISNYYSGYMICIFLVFFAPVMYFAYLRKSEITVGSFFKTAGRFALGSVIAGAISAVIVIPTFIILRHTSAVSDEFPVDFTPASNLFDFLGRLMVSANPNIRNGMANVACGTVIVLLLPLFFAIPRTHISLRKKVGFAFMLAFMYLSFSTKTLNFIWHGFHYPNQIPYRQSYMMSFLLVLIAFMTIRNLKKFTTGQLASVSIGAGIFLLLYEKFGTGTEGYRQIALSLLFLFVQFFVLRRIVLSTRENAHFLSLILTITMLFESLVMAAFTIGTVCEDEGFTSYEFYAKNRSVIHDYALALEGSDGHKNFERTELYPNNICDIQSVYDVKGMSVFSSTARESLIQYMRNFGFHNNGINGVRNAGLTRVTATLLGVRNQATIEETQKIPLMFPVTAEMGDVTFYGNSDALAVGYLTSEDIVNYTPNSAITDVFYKTNDWVRAMGVEADVYLPVVAQSSDESGMTCTGKAGNSLAYNITASGSKCSYKITIDDADIGADVYVYADSSKGGTVTLSEGGVVSKTYEIRSYQIIYLGTFSGQSLSAEITYKEAPAGSVNVYAYELNAEGYEEMVSTLSSNQLDVTNYDDTSLEGTIDAGDGGFLFLTIPYSEGFSVTVDGAEAELTAVCDALCGIYLDGGVHGISLKYVPQGFYPSLFISIAGVVALAAVVVITNIRRLKEDEEEETPDKARAAEENAAV